MLQLIGVLTQTKHYYSIMSYHHIIVITV